MGFVAHQNGRRFWKFFAVEQNAHLLGRGVRSAHRRQWSTECRHECDQCCGRLLLGLLGQLPDRQVILPQADCAQTVPVRVHVRTGVVHGAGACDGVQPDRGGVTHLRQLYDVLLVPRRRMDRGVRLRAQLGGHSRWLRVHFLVCHGLCSPIPGGHHTERGCLASTVEHHILLVRGVHVVLGRCFQLHGHRCATRMGQDRRTARRAIANQDLSSRVLV